VPPFVEFYPSPSSVGIERQDGEELYIRPLLAHETWLDDEASRTKVLLPALLFHSEPTKQIHHLLGIFRFGERRLATGGEDMDWMLFPILYGGSDPNEGAYFGFFPFGGKLKGLLGQDEIDFWLFPLYLRMQDGERVSTHWMWPLGNTVEGAGWSGWRIMPFWADYAWDTEDGRPRSRRRAIAWPFYIRNTEWMQQDPTEVFLSFPFYGYYESSRSVRESFTPFWVRYRDKRDPEANLDGGFLLPWRVGRDHHDLWPFWGTKYTQEKSELSGTERERFRQFAVWPIQRWDWARDDREETSRLWILPFFWRYEYKTLGEDGENRLRWKLWPLFGYRHEGERVEVDVASPWWNYREDYHRFWERLFALFRYRSRPGYEGWELLYGTVYAGFGRRTEDGPDESLFSFLGGLFECGTREDNVVVRFLWIPWW